jgi:hypothetical protein
MTPAERQRAIDALPVAFELRAEDLPRAPSEEAWARMTPEERERAVDALPSSFPLEDMRPVYADTPPSAGSFTPPQGDLHYNTVQQVRSTLDGYFARMGRPVYLACDLPVYYPGEPMFAPDILAVVDVGTHPRMHWTVTREGRGLDLALEVIVAGDPRKDVERYARLGIREYFVFDRRRLRLLGYRLGPGRRYEPLVPQFGYLHSEVLGLDLRRDDTRLRFYAGTAPVPEADERIATLEGMLESLEDHVREAEARLEEEARARAEEARARAEEEAARRAAEAKLAAALAELERLRGSSEA